MSSGSRRPITDLGIAGGSNSSQLARMLAALEPLLERARARTRVLALRRHQLDARRRARGRRPRRRRSSTSRRACARSTAASPRSATACSPTSSRRCCCARATAAAGSSRRERRPGRAVVVGDVMVDVALRDARARARARASRSSALGVEPGGYVLATAHRAANVDDPARSSGSSPLLEAVERADRAARCTRGPSRGSQRHGLDARARAPRR